MSSLTVASVMDIGPNCEWFKRELAWLTFGRLDSTRAAEEDEEYVMVIATPPPTPPEPPKQSVRWFNMFRK